MKFAPYLVILLLLAQPTEQASLSILKRQAVEAAANASDLPAVDALDASMEAGEPESVDRFPKIVMLQVNS